jgi:hypothetical protein
MVRLKKIFWFFLASLFLFEAWLWDWLGSALGRVVDALPLDDLRTGFEAFVRRRSPWASLTLFAFPLALLAPIKFAALYFLAHHHLVAGLGCFLAAKLIGFASGAYLFDLCRPQLLKIAFFAQLYATLTRWRALARDMIAPYRAALQQKLEPFRMFWLRRRTGARPSLAARLRKWSRRRLT